MRKAAACFLLLACLFPFAGCGNDRITPRDLYDAFSARYPLMPHVLCDSEAGEGEDGYLSPADFTLLFGREDGSDDREDIVSFLLCLGSSGTVFYELGFFRCVDRAAACEVEGLCLHRCETVRKMRGEVDLSAAEEPLVLRYGTLVLYLALPDNDRAEAVLSKIL